MDAKSAIGPVVLLAIVLASLQGCPPPVTPTPTPPAPSPSSLAAVAKQLAESRVNAAPRGTQAQLVAAAWRKLADEIETLADPLSRSTLATPADCVAAANTRAAEALGGSAANWEPFFRDLYAELNRREAAGEISRTVYGVAQALSQVADGLDQVR